ncbi:LLM class flavin-dependent oxidoreductase [Streptomyces sp. NBC_01450]|uniref:MupA/Atu3671 family FMN-dependent luciferase-like monooxygenase n=1 Tax=Streptomyces sp. NBC_01450 TaxID=2903871 RepID=UPI002E35B572|nr:MupA/Atu3671 family FMN-dependent luciferase-like monooxygenase [Streptomyces sp. NBC_01450]
MTTAQISPESRASAEAVARTAAVSGRLDELLAVARHPAEPPAGQPAEPPLHHGPHVTLPPDSGMSGTGASEAQRAHADGLVRRFTERTRASKELAQRHRRVLADSRAVVGFRRATKEMQYPIAARSAHGARLTDVDGNDYTDITMGFGALLLGHEPAPVTEAVRRHLAGGLRLGPRSEDTGAAAELLAELTGMERVAFANSGTEANSAALRLARAATGRDRVVMFRGSYHGHIDSVLGRPGPDGRHAVPVSRGVPASAVSELLVLEYGSQESLDVIDELGDTIAAVLVEPVQCRNPALRPVAFLRTLRELTARRGIVLLFDEMLTGLRPHPRGAQHHYGVVPDLATYGKALGSGHPIGAIAGRADLMDGVDGGFWRYGDDSRPTRDTTFFGGTYIQHPLSMAAARAVLTHLKERGPGLQQTLNARTDALAADLDDFFRAEELPLETAHFGSMFRFTHRADMELLYHHLLLRGIYVWEWRSFYLSTAHTDTDVERIADAVKDSLRELRAGGYFPTAARRGRGHSRGEAAERPAPDFGVYFFGDHPDGEDSAQAYERLIETARFADTHDFSTLWLPERHFHSFGGLFPNPSVLAAALARETRRIRLHAGSVVLPLHDPVRIAEEWAVADNLSGGRVGIGCASGWHASDFALHPDRFTDRTEIAFQHLEDVRRLWRGESVPRHTGEGHPIDVRPHPRPVQELPPMYLATSGRRASYEEAARRDLGIVTNLMNQTVEQLAANIRHYRRTRAESGLDPETGRVTVLLHTHLAEDHAAARAAAREPMSRYLRSSLQMRSAASALGGRPEDVADASEADLAYLFDRAYDRYCDQRALIGSPDTCAATVDALRAAGVDEIAALVDFGLPPEEMEAGLEQLDVLRRRYHEPPKEPKERRAPATPAQRRLWLAATLIADPAAYNEIQGVRLRGPLDVEALRTAVDGLVRRHDGLRTVFVAGGDGVFQVVREDRDRDRDRDRAGPALAVDDVRGRDADEVIRAALREESTRAYDLAAGPLFTPRLLRLADDDHALILGMHHLVTDGHSAGLVAADLGELYRAAVEGRAPRFERAAGSTLDAAAATGGADDLDWWRAHLRDGPGAPALPTDRPRTRTVAGRGGAVGLRLGPERAGRLREWSGRQGVTLFATLLTAWRIVLRQYAGQDDFVIGSTFGRRTPETWDTVGFHVSLLPLRGTLTDATTLTDALRATRDTLFAADARQHVDVDALLASRHPDPGNPRPLVTVSADLDTAPLTALALPGLRAEPLDGGTESAPLELALMATRRPDGDLDLRIRYDADLFDEKTARGCLDRLEDVLTAMTAGAAATVGDLTPGSVAPGTPVTPDSAHRLRTLWQHTLGPVGDLTPDANFFELGGNSIGAIRLVNRVRDSFGVEYPLADFFADATLGAMTARLAPPRGVTVVDTAPVSDQQARMIAGVLGMPRPEVWNIPTRIRFTGPLDVAALRTAVAGLLDRHHGLRCRFVPGDGRPVPSSAPDDGTGWRQEVLDVPPPALPVEDLTGIADESERLTHTEELCRAAAATPIALTEPVLPVLRLLREAPDRWTLMFVVHHICVDGWALSLLLDELTALYTAAATGRPHGLPEPAAQCTDYARWQRAHADPAEEARRTAYWTRYLEGIPATVEIPGDRPRPAVPSGRGDTLRGTASGELRRAVEELAAARHTTPFGVAATALGVLVARRSGVRDIAMGTPYAHRERSAFESMVALTSTGVVVRVTPDPDETRGALVRRTGAGALEATAHVLPTARIVRALRESGARAVPERFPLTIAFQNSLDTDIEIPGLDVEVDDLAPPVSRGDLSFGLAPRRDPAKGYRTFLEYSADLWDPATAQELLDDWQAVLAELCTRPDAPVAPLLNPLQPLRKA